MSLNPGGGQNYGWNYSRPDKEGYSTQLVGTVLAIQEVQKRSYNPGSTQPGAPEFWPDGNPKMNIRMLMCDEYGEFKTFVFQPASKAAREGRKRSVHMDLFALTGNTDMTKLIGQTIMIQTQEGQYHVGNPRPWYVQLVEAGPFKPNQEMPAEFKLPRVLCDEAAHGGQVQHPQPQYGYQQQQPMQPRQQGYGYQQGRPPMQQPQPAYGYQQPQPQPQPAYGYQPQPAMPPQQPQYRQPQVQPQPLQGYYQQPVQQPVQQPQQAEMDPVILQQMGKEVFGEGTQVTFEQAQQPQGDLVGAGQSYDDDDSDDMPF